VKLIQGWLGNSSLLFISSIGRVYDLSSDPNTTHQKTLEEYTSDIPDFLLRLSTLLEDIQANSAEDSENHCKLTSDLAELLGLATDPDNGDTIKMPLAVYNAGNYVCLIRCSGCNAPLVYRLYFHYGKAFAPRPKVYRIPGLGYTTSYPNGVGLIISNNRIVGRMMFGSSACECKPIEIIEIK
jgi:hypothetical protein